MYIRKCTAPIYLNLKKTMLHTVCMKIWWCFIVQIKYVQSNFIIETNKYFKISLIFFVAQRIKWGPSPYHPFALYTELKVVLGHFFTFCIKMVNNTSFCIFSIHWNISKRKQLHSQNFKIRIKKKGWCFWKILILWFFQNCRQKWPTQIYVKKIEKYSVNIMYKIVI